MKNCAVSRPQLALLLSLAAIAWLPPVPALAEAPPAGTYITIPDVIEGPDGRVQSAERGLFFVPENRWKPDSRIIAIHFLRFPASNDTPGRPPVFLLPGGPGSDYDFSRANNFEMAERLRKTRDLIAVSQRGNPRAPSLVPPLWYQPEPAAPGEADSADKASRRLSAAVQATQDEWADRGVDLAGYDIVNIVDDVYELRAALGYDKLVLNACSFGSQWSFAYLKRWPETVDRALLSGVEPLDYAYDSPRWLWASMARLAALAESDPHLAPFIPRDGLMAALQEVLTRLEERPVTVTIEDRTGRTQDVTIGAYDLQRQIRSSFGDTRREQFENWPRYLLELYRGDYRYLAALTWESRSRDSRNPLIGPLIDNSLGITATRDKRLLNERAARWLGDINGGYRATRDLTVTRVVDDDFRADSDIEVPVLLVNGDLDWSTPLENAEHALRFLEQGHLVTVAGAGHCPIGVELMQEMPETAEQILSFIDVDFADVGPAEFFAGLPDRVSTPPFEFRRPVGPALYEQWLQAAGN